MIGIGVPFVKHRFTAAARSRAFASDADHTRRSSCPVGVRVSAGGCFCPQPGRAPSRIKLKKPWTLITFRQADMAGKDTTSWRAWEAHPASGSVLICRSGAKSKTRRSVYDGLRLTPPAQSRPGNCTFGHYPSPLRGLELRQGFEETRRRDCHLTPASTPGAVGGGINRSAFNTAHCHHQR